MKITLTDYYKDKPVSLYISRIKKFGHDEDHSPTVICRNGEIIATVKETPKEILIMMGNDNDERHTK